MCQNYATQEGVSLNEQIQIVNTLSTAVRQRRFSPFEWRQPLRNTYPLQNLPTVCKCSRLCAPLGFGFGIMYWPKNALVSPARPIRDCITCWFFGVSHLQKAFLSNKVQGRPRYIASGAVCFRDVDIQARRTRQTWWFGLTSISLNRAIPFSPFGWRRHHPLS